MKMTVTFSIHNPMNKGNFLSARIYSDDNKKNLCKCGGKFSLYKAYEDTGYEIPVCGKCKSYPKKYRIKARIEDQEGCKKSVFIRYNQKGKRLDRSSRVVDTLDTIIEELQDGEFDSRNYDKKEARVNKTFVNFVDNIFLPQTEIRWKNKEISKSTLNNYKKECNHLRKFFKQSELDKINNEKLRMFMRTYDATTETKNRASNVLRTILNEAYKQNLKKFPPKLDRMKTSRKRLEVMDYKTARKIWTHIKDQKYKDIIDILLTYPIRPSEAYVLRSENFDTLNRKITFDHHLSDGELTEGRKSQGVGTKYGKITLPLTNRVHEIFIRHNSNNKYLFRGVRSSHVSEKAVRLAWNKARKEAGVIPTKECKYQLYEIKHAVVSHLNANGVSIATIEKMSGVRAKTLMERYLYSDSMLVDEAVNILQFKEAT